MEKSFNTQLDELNKILHSLEKESVSIDEMSEQLNTAFTLLDSLQNKLRNVELKVEEIINLRTANSSEV